jgi:hypothetical protein
VKVRSWIPSFIIVGILLAGASVAVVVQLQGIGHPRTLPPAVGDHGYSKFDDAGMRYISDTRKVWIDLRSLPMSAASLKLPASDTVSIGPREGVDEYFGLYGNGTPVQLPVESIQVVTKSGLLDHVEAIVESHGYFADVREALEGARAYGIDDEQIESFIQTATKLNRAGTAFSKTVGPGDALGPPITVKIECEVSSDCRVSYVVDTRAP